MWSNFSSLARSEPLLFGNLQEGIWIGIVDQFVSPLKMDISLKPAQKTSFERLTRESGRGFIFNVVKGK